MPRSRRRGPWWSGADRRTANRVPVGRLVDSDAVLGIPDGGVGAGLERSGQRVGQRVLHARIVGEVDEAFVHDLGARLRGQILRRAGELASIDGLEQVSIGRLAAAMGMSKSGLYAYFTSKEDLQLATIESAWQIFDEHVLGGSEPFWEHMLPIASR